MPRKSRTKKGGEQSAEYRRLRGEIARRGNILLGLGEFKLSGDLNRFRRLFPEMLGNKAYRQLIWPNERPTSTRDIWRNGIPSLASFEAELEWSVQALLPQAAKLEAFLLKKAQFERLHLTHSPDALLNLLDTVDNEFGLSLWAIENRINALQMQSGFKSQRKYTSDMLKDGSTSALTRYVISWFSFRSEENISAQEFGRLVEDSVSPESQVYSLIRIILGIEVSLDESAAAKAIAHIDGLPPIDRYLFLLSIAQAVVASGNPEPIDAVQRSMSALSAAVSDPLLRRLVAALGTDVDRIESRMLPVLDAYVRGDLRQAEVEGSKLIAAEASVEALVIAARIGITTGRPFSAGWPTDSLISKIAADVLKLTLAQNEASDAEARLAKLATVNPRSSWSASIDLFLQHQRLDERLHHASPAQTFSALRAFDENPFLAYAMPFSLGKSYLERMSGYQNRSPAVLETLRVIENTSKLSATFGKKAHRAKRVVAIEQLRRGDFGAAVAILSGITPKNTTPVELLESRLLMAEALLRGSRLKEACAICVDLMLDSPYLARRLPLSRLIEALASWDQAADRSRRVLGDFSIVMLIYMYGKHVSSDREELTNDAFIDFLDKEGIEKPSDVEFDTSRDWRQFAYFLQYVCVPESLDQCFALRSTREVEDERARIIVRCGDIYTDHNEPAPAVLQDELQKIRTAQVIRDTSLKLDQSKIYVDIEGIQAQLGNPMRENWNRYRLLGLQQDNSASLTELVRDLEDVLGRKVALVATSLPVTERNKLFDRMVREIRDQFSASKLFGLDANLSTNVRHGYVLRELRRPFVTALLVTNLISSESGYRPNKHWLERLSISEDIRSTAIISVLDNFSREIDEEIERLTRSRMRILSATNPDGLFDFSIDDISLQLLQQRLDDSGSYEDFLKSTFELLWALTQIGLDRVKLCLHEETLSRFNASLDKLQEGVELLLTFEEASSLKQAISLVRPEVTAAVERVSSWFALSTSHEYQDYPVRIAFDVGLATVTSYFSHLDIEASIQGGEAIIMVGSTLPAFARLFLLLMENAALHSGIAEGRLTIDATAKIDGDQLELSIANALSMGIDRSGLKAIVSRLNSEFGGEAAADSVATERGSGYAKLWKILRYDLRREYIIEVNLPDDGSFRVDIVLNKAGVVRENTHH